VITTNGLEAIFRAFGHHDLGSAAAGPLGGAPTSTRASVHHVEDAPDPRREIRLWPGVSDYVFDAGVLPTTKFEVAFGRKFVDGPRSPPRLSRSLKSNRPLGERACDFAERSRLCLSSRSNSGWSLPWDRAWAMMATLLQIHWTA